MAPSAAHLEIRSDVLDSARMTLAEMQTELAIHLYEHGRLSVGKAHELAGPALVESRPPIPFSRLFRLIRNFSDATDPFQIEPSRVDLISLISLFSQLQ